MVLGCLIIGSLSFLESIGRTFNPIIPVFFHLFWTQSSYFVFHVLIPPTFYSLTVLYELLYTR